MGLLNNVMPFYNWLSAVMVPWGLVILFVLAFCESIYPLGLITPGEVVVIAAAFVATTSGIHIGIIWVIGFLGGFLGNVVAYIVGYRIGPDGIRAGMQWWNTKIAHTFLRRFATIDPNLVDDTATYFERHGLATAFLARFAYGIKTLIPPMAGAVRMSPWKYFSASAVGGGGFTALLAFVGWMLAENVHLAGNIFKATGWVTAGVFVLLVVFAVIMVRKIYVKRTKSVFEHAVHEDIEA